MVCLCCVGIVIALRRRDRGKRGEYGRKVGGEGNLFRMVIPPLGF